MEVNRHRSFVSYRELELAGEFSVRRGHTERMDQFRLPSPLLLTTNLEENWQRWEQSYQIYMTVSGADGVEEKIIEAILLHSTGEEALEVYNMLNIDHDEEENVEDILTAFRACYQP